MDNGHVARILYEMADIHEIEGKSHFRVRALRNAALTVETLPLDVIGLARTGGAGRLKEIAGIGAGIAKKIIEIGERGDCHEHEEQLERVPRSLLEILEVPGVGPKKVKLFQSELGVRSLDDLDLAARGGKVRELPRMGAKSEAKLVTAIERHRLRTGRFLQSKAGQVMARLTAMLRDIPGVQRVEPAGSFRRRRETIGDLDILCICDDPELVMDRFAAGGEVIGRGHTKCSIRLSSGLNVDLRIVPAESFGAAMHYFTGSKAHNVAIRTRAVKRGLTINEYGVFEVGDDGEAGERIGGATEEEVFAAVGLPWIPPELREASGEIEAAEHGKLPALIARSDLRGDLHMHTQATDGSGTVMEMAEAAIERGHRYVAITDHSKALAMTGGLDEAKLEEQAAVIAAAQEQVGTKIRILRGIEVDILAEGDLDLTHEALGQLDVVIGSIHSRFELTREEMTARLLKAIGSGVVDVIGHPTGRLLLRRDPYVFDIEAIFEAAAKHGVAMEISASPYRLDLCDTQARLARSLGVKLVINTDAHHTESLDLLPYGIGVARRAWLEPGDVLNTIEDPDAFLKALHEGHR
jgi:DNA polymerase (family 10)